MGRWCSEVCLSRILSPLQEFERLLLLEESKAEATIQPHRPAAAVDPTLDLYLVSLPDANRKIEKRSASEAKIIKSGDGAN